jgi:hypothetical protein
MQLRALNLTRKTNLDNGFGEENSFNFLFIYGFKITFPNPKPSQLLMIWLELRHTFPGKDK